MVRLKNGYHTGWRHYVTILVNPALMVLFAWLCWYPSWKRGWYLPGVDGTLIQEPFIGFIGMFHAILVGFASTWMWSDRKETLRAIWRRDEEAFALSLRDRMPRDIQLLIGVMSVLVWIAFAVLPYQHPVTGFFMVGSASFMLAVYWQVATSLDDQLKDPEVVRQIPAEWMRQASDGKLYPRCLLEDDEQELAA